jgi:hypothetical protein
MWFLSQQTLGGTPMTWGELSRKNYGWGWKLVGDIYDTVHMALWSLLITFVIFFCVFTLPRMPQLRAEMQAQRILDLQAETGLTVRSGALRTVPRSTSRAFWT